MIPQINPQTSAANFKPKNLSSLFLGLELESDSSQASRSNQLTAPGGLKVARVLDRWIPIVRPTIAYPFTRPLFSQPRDSDRTAHINWAVRDLNSAPVISAVERASSGRCRVVRSDHLGSHPISSNVPDHVRSWPSKENPAVAASSSSSRSPTLACAVRNGRGVGRASSRRVGAGFNGSH